MFDDKLEPILWPFPCSNSMQRGFEAFLAMRPWDMLAAREFVSGRDQSDHVAYWAIGHHPKLRHTIEVRHGSFVDLPFIHLLRRYAAVVVPDCTGHWPCIEDIAANLIYLHLHSTGSKYAGAYKRPSAAALSRAA
ncbi:MULTISPECIES: DUF72 domain-containing protein [Mycetohabitans]|uniref:DUF72 domain-containing protein n=1 Tax=Mycetohabitans TaxID=2571159 RepID=UPI001F1BF0E3